MSLWDEYIYDTDDEGCKLLGGEDAYYHQVRAATVWRDHDKGNPDGNEDGPATVTITEVGGRVLSYRVDDSQIPGRRNFTVIEFMSEQELGLRYLVIEQSKGHTLVRWTEDHAGEYRNLLNR